MVKGYLSKYLLFSEYTCPHCGKFPPDFNIRDLAKPFSTLFNIADAIREIYGYPIPMHGYRCLKHNANVTDTEYSVHPFGLALDMKGKAKELAEIVEQEFPELRMGIYPKHIHIDVGYLIFPRATEDWHEGARWRGTYK